MRITRLAPSPTGALHLGNARTFLVNWLLARRNGWKIVLRIEDLDGPRIKQGSATGAMDDLRWLGLDWDEGPIYQSSRKALYESAVHELGVAGQAYACVCTRKEVELAASAPHAEDGASIYPSTCRGRFASLAAAAAAAASSDAAAGRAPAVRFLVPPGIMEFEDAFAGPLRFDAARELGDFVIAKSDGTAAYQLAVVIDDAAMEVTDVVRGDDLLDSTPRQILLYRALGLTEKIPRYFHLPLVVGTDGRRLAKRHGDTRLVTYREAGVKPGRVLSLLARWCGIDIDDVPEAQITAHDLLRRFELARMPRERIVFNASDDRWLLESSDVPPPRSRQAT
jgi:glutamyl-tRNA synthetase